jgi:hypothetical protein
MIANHDNAHKDEYTLAIAKGHIHQNQQTNAICLEKECKLYRKLLCIKCLKNNH